MAGCRQGRYGRGSYDEFLRFDLETLVAPLEQGTFPAHEDAVAVKSPQKQQMVVGPSSSRTGWPAGFLLSQHCWQML